MAGETIKIREVIGKESGFFEEKNRKHRRTMEDHHNLIDNFGGEDFKAAYFGVYDGHGGETAAKFCEDHLPKAVESELAGFKDEDFDNDDKVRDAIQKGYRKADEDMKSTVASAGACVVTAVIKRFSDNRRKIFVANLGDSRAVLIRDGAALRLSKEHKSSDPEEQKRILDNKGFIDPNGRVNAILAVTRALGDHNMKGPGKDFVSNEIYYRSETVTDKDVALILACDGLWDVVTEEDAAKVLLGEMDKETKLTARALLAQAMRSGSTDNITVLVIKL
jgi:protein phosphatase PTC1